MEWVRRAVACLVVCAVMVSMMSVLFADKIADKDKVKFLKHVARTLRHSNPDISKALKVFADGEEKERSGEGAVGAGPENGTPGNKINQREEHMKLLRDAAQAIQRKDPPAAQRLSNWADYLEKKLKRRNEEDLDEMEEMDVAVPVNQDNF